MKLLENFFMYSQNKKCIEGNHVYKPYLTSSVTGQQIKGHRHDQSILSILRARYNAPVQNLDIFGEWRNIDYCNKNGSYIYVHRRSYKNHKNTKYKKQYDTHR